MLPTSSEPKGEICLYLDAILNLAEYMGVDPLSLILKVFFCQVYVLLHYRTKLNVNINYLKAEKFANRAFKKLEAKKMIYDYRIKIYMDEKDKVAIIARQKWIEKWTELPLAECFNMIEK